MVRVIIGAAAAAVVMLMIGFIFATPLARLGMAGLDDAWRPRSSNRSPPACRAPAPIRCLARTRPRRPTCSRRPIATVHYNTNGFAGNDPMMFVFGLVFNFIVALLIGAALIGIDRRVSDFACARASQ